MRIRLIAPPEAPQLRQARMDEAIVTGQPFFEKPYYYENIETGQQYHDLFGCVGWPNVITDKNKAPNKPGYIAIVGIIKNSEPVEKAPFRIMEEFESHNILYLFDEMVRMRNEWGYGLHPDLLRTWIGDSDRFITELAIFNDEFVRYGKPQNSILIAPPDDFGIPNMFDVYTRAISQSLDSNTQRLYYGGNTILRNRIKEFMDKDPIIIGMGGLVYSLIRRRTWMEQAQENVFVVEEGI
jgi:hypothetical protein